MKSCLVRFWTCHFIAEPLLFAYGNSRSDTTYLLAFSGSKPAFSRLNGIQGIVQIENLEEGLVDLTKILSRPARLSFCVQYPSSSQFQRCMLDRKSSLNQATILTECPA